ncbi:tail assembly chaperone [Haloarcula hispanica tailed virus 2]|uniref:Uncharacterized protein n=1 Tax=Haloarcula hispanica tailed virus 2 TaxID=1273751 RepID=R4TM22_9CAUD|nr:tail assembly chaperone [Haloarcula hispanica tailed virus 2]AGM11213.1 hypothetical protein HHTV2_48 [Haloarcula hispanica tailed virus 2]
MRRSKIEDPAVLEHVPTAIEMVLVKEAGYNLEDIRGERRVETEVVPPSSLESFVGSLVPSAAWKVVGVILGLGALTAYSTGALSGLFVSVLLGVALHYLGQFNPEPQEVVREVETPGMTVDEVMGRLVQHDEHEQMKNEEAEAQARKARRQGQGGGGP